MNRIWCSNCSELRITALHSSISCAYVYLLRYKKKWLHSFQRWKHDNCIDIDYWSKRYWKRNHSNIAADLHLGRDSSQLVLQIQLSTETQEKWVSQSSGTSLVQGKKPCVDFRMLKQTETLKFVLFYCYTNPICHDSASTVKWRSYVLMDFLTNSKYTHTHLGKFPNMNSG